MPDSDPPDPTLRPVPLPEQDDHAAEDRAAGAGRRRAGRGDGGWEAVVREELLKLRRRSASGLRVAPLPRRRGPRLPGEPPPAA
jgi:hypothetical protein